ncbi:MAG: hypothetical protein ACOYOK_09540 [Pseudobdellovibrionaceae bacterium]
MHFSKYLIFFILAHSLCLSADTANEDQDPFFDDGTEIRCLRTNKKTKSGKGRTTCDLSQELAFVDPDGNLSSNSQVLAFSTANPPNRGDGKWPQSSSDKIYYNDSALFLKVIKKMRRPEFRVNDIASTLIYKFFNKNLSFLFTCIVRNPSGILDSNCILYFNPFRTDPEVIIAFDGRFVNIQFTNPDVVAKIQSVLFEQNSDALIAKEPVGVKMEGVMSYYPKASFSCTANACEFRGIPEQSNNEAEDFVAPRIGGDEDIKEPRKINNDFYFD